SSRARTDRRLPAARWDSLVVIVVPVVIIIVVIVPIVVIPVIIVIVVPVVVIPIVVVIFDDHRGSGHHGLTFGRSGLGVGGFCRGWRRLGFWSFCLGGHGLVCVKDDRAQIAVFWPTHDGLDGKGRSDDGNQSDCNPCESGENQA